MRNGKFTSIETVPVSEKPIPLKDILQPESEVNDKYYLNEDDILKFKTLRGAKKFNVFLLMDICILFQKEVCPKLMI